MQLKRRALFTLLVSMCLGAVVPSVAQARRSRVRLKVRGIRQGQSCPGYPIMSRDALRACVRVEDDINAKISVLDAADASLQLDARRIQERERYLEAHERAVDSHSRESVDGYNALIPEYKNLVVKYNRRVAAQNSEARLAQDAISGFNSSCAKRCYYEHDMDAILKEKDEAQRLPVQPGNRGER